MKQKRWTGVLTMLLVLALFLGGCGLGGVKSYRKNKDCPKKAPFLLWQSCFYCYFIVRYMVASVCAVSMMPPPINPSP